MNTEQVRAASGMNFALGLWLIFSPLILGYTYNRIATEEAIAVGVVVVLIALLRLTHPDHSRWGSFVNLLLGLVLIGSAFLLGAQGADAAQWDNLTIGFSVVVVALWGAISVVRPGQE